MAPKESIESLRNLSDIELLGQLNNSDAIYLAPLDIRERGMVMGALTDEPMFSGEQEITAVRDEHGTLKVSKLYLHTAVEIQEVQ